MIWMTGTVIVVYYQCTLEYIVSYIVFCSEMCKNTSCRSVVHKKRPQLIFSYVIKIREVLAFAEWIK